MMRYRASKLDCDACSLKPRCCPNTPARKILRSIHEGARDMARDIATTEDYVTSRRQRKKVEMLFAHLKRILKLDRLRLRGPNGARDEFHLAATAQNLRKLAKLVPCPRQPWREAQGCLPFATDRSRAAAAPNRLLQRYPPFSDARGQIVTAGKRTLGWYVLGKALNVYEVVTLRWLLIRPDLVSDRLTRITE